MQNRMAIILQFWLKTRDLPAWKKNLANVADSHGLWSYPHDRSSACIVVVCPPQRKPSPHYNATITMGHLGNCIFRVSQWTFFHILCFPYKLKNVLLVSSCQGSFFHLFTVSTAFLVENCKKAFHQCLSCHFSILPDFCNYTANSCELGILPAPPQLPCGTMQLPLLKLFYPTFRYVW